MILEIRANLPLLGREETFVVDGQSMPLAVALERFVLWVALVRACGFRLLCNDLIEEHRSAPSGADGKSCPVRFAHECWVALRDEKPRNRLSRTCCGPAATRSALLRGRIHYCIEPNTGGPA